MITLSPSMDMFGIRATGGGVSQEASEIQEWVSQSFNHYLEPRLSLLRPEIEGLVGSVEGGPTVDIETIGAAIRFAYCLPRFAPLPELSVDPDGEISFDWVAPSGRMFSVSVNGRGRLAYAGWFGEKSRVHGIEQLSESCPPEILRGIQKATDFGPRII